jgi:hypothetical protein
LQHRRQRGRRGFNDGRQRLGTTSFLARKLLGPHSVKTIVCLDVNDRKFHGGTHHNRGGSVSAAVSRNRPSGRSDVTFWKAADLFENVRQAVPKSALTGTMPETFNGIPAHSSCNNPHTDAHNSVPSIDL